ncbi:ABC-F family ATP-binding cassette domain-containing protein [Nocardiopsis sp. MG754419]|uniref:ABC-F family ATP-binding cassette domain-containing protein n=1 Tax=Nocardiopsis sp. MG754419 TaxID=2259865 RepID=UPI001BA6FC6E|nr:ABC-F family ATP-binding cassette domain-containing protein [Nocardiopsis sp. MG754419]MBR8745133.1 ABC transporter ATP-binding protein [Nocardiopsis sp. MG754419]
MPTALPARSRAQLALSGISVVRGAHHVLVDTDLTVTPTSRIAIVGENGRGKTTLLHVLAGTLTPDAGTVALVGTRGLAEQEMSTADARTVGEVLADAVADSLATLTELDTAGLALGEGTDGAEERYARALQRAEALDAWDAARRLHIALDALGAESDPARRLTELSVGQRYRVRLACLLGAGHDFLLLDEPTNHLDRGGLDFLTERLRRRSGGVVLVSHDRALLADVADTVVDLDPTDDGRPRIHGGGYTGYRQGRRAERERWEQAYAHQQDEKARLQDLLSSAQNRLVSRWRPDKGTGKHQRATRAGGLVKNVHRRRADLEAHEITMPEPPQRFRFPDLPTRSGTTLLAAEDVTVADRLATATSLTLRAGARLVVTGPNGTGKSTLLSVLAGALEPTTGRVYGADEARVALLGQESDLPSDRRVADVYTAHVDRLVSRRGLRADETVGLSSLGLLRPRETGKRVAELSMGQRRRLDLALALARRPHVLLLDEPTNHLSVALVDELTEALDVTEAAVVVSTHDRRFLRDVEAWPRLDLGARVSV